VLEYREAEQGLALLVAEELLVAEVALAQEAVLAERAVLEISLLAEQVLLDQFTLELLAAEQESRVLEVQVSELQAERAV
jgi:hypothetical protein